MSNSGKQYPHISIYSNITGLFAGTVYRDFGTYYTVQYRESGQKRGTAFTIDIQRALHIYNDFVAVVENPIRGQKSTISFVNKTDAASMQGYYIIRCRIVDLGGEDCDLSCAVPPAGGRAKINVARGRIEEWTLTTNGGQGNDVFQPKAYPA